MESKRKSHNRIIYYSNLLNKGEDIISRYPSSFNEFIAFKDNYEQLNSYYGSKQYMDDLKADEDGLVSKDINRSILGEDYCYDFLLNYERILLTLHK